MAEGICAIEDCERPRQLRGVCRYHYNKACRAGSLASLPRVGRGYVPEAERFWALVEKTDSCWLWTAHLDRWGYGVFFGDSTGTGKRRSVSAHRMVYLLWHGEPVPSDLQLDHLCRVRHCVRPDHLEPVTGLVNMRRSAAARRGGST